MLRQERSRDVVNVLEPAVCMCACVDLCVYDLPDAPTRLSLSLSLARARALSRSLARSHSSQHPSRCVCDRLCARVSACQEAREGVREGVGTPLSLSNKDLSLSLREGPQACACRIWHTHADKCTRLSLSFSHKYSSML
jgi:hypothetical protein